MEDQFPVASLYLLITLTSNILKKEKKRGSLESRAVMRLVKVEWAWMGKTGGQPDRERL